MLTTITMANGEIKRDPVIILKDGKHYACFDEHHSINDVLRHLISEADWDEGNACLQRLKKESN